MWTATVKAAQGELNETRTHERTDAPSRDLLKCIYIDEVDSTAVDPGKDGSVRITISCHYKDNFAYRYFWQSVPTWRSRSVNQVILLQQMLAALSWNRMRSLWTCSMVQRTTIAWDNPLWAAPQLLANDWIASSSPSRNLNMPSVA